MSDQRYLKRRGGRWYFQIAVPSDLQSRYGRKVIVEALGTSDLREAQRLRNAQLAKAKEVFHRLRRNRELTPEEVEASAQAIFRDLLSTAPQVRAPIAAHTGDDSDAQTAGLEMQLDAVLEALKDGNFSMVRGEAADIIATTGATMEPDAPTYHDLCYSLLMARKEAYTAMLALRRGELPKKPKAPFNPAVIDPVTLEIRGSGGKSKATRSKEGLLFSQASERYVTERMRDTRASWSNQTKAQYETTFRLFSDFIGNGSLASVTRQDASEFLSEISRLHPDWGRSPKAKGLALKDLLRNFSSEAGLSNRTLNRHATALSGLFRWARRQGLVDGDNPFAEQSRAKGRKSESGWRPFTSDELNLFFGSKLFKTAERERLSPSRHTMNTTFLWAPLIALYSGMRSGELCQLRLDDVRQEEGVWYFSVNEDTEGQRVKTEAAVRRVPVHSQLIRCGFLEYLETVSEDQSGRLFPALKPGGRDQKYNAYFTKRFTDLRRRIGLTRERLGFHSFRKNVGTALERARVPENEAVQILGHEKLSMSYSVYSLGLELAHLRDVVERIEYPSLKLSHLYRRS